MTLQFAALPDEAKAWREKVRSFLSTQAFTPRVDSWSHADPTFSKACGHAGLIGLTWPKEYGGQERSPLERYVVLEEFLAAGAPVGAHWGADRQSGGQILKFGSEKAKHSLIPQIVTGDCYFAIGMSESEAGSDLTAIRTVAKQVKGGWSIRGRKLWTTNAHVAHYVIVLARSGQLEGGNRHAGLTQFIVPLKTPGVIVSPIHDLTGAAEFNEVLFDDAFVPDHLVLGEVNQGWSLLTHELAAERSGPERFMSTFVLLSELAEKMKDKDFSGDVRPFGRLMAHLLTLRSMSISVASSVAGGHSPVFEAALVKDLGNSFEQDVPTVARDLVAGRRGHADAYERALRIAIMRSPCFSLRGGTREVLRNTVARGVGLR